MAATTEAVETYRRLAATHPAAFEPNLAMSLNNLGSDLSDLGRPEEADWAYANAETLQHQSSSVEATSAEV